jgi:hypothetical protein
MISKDSLTLRVRLAGGVADALDSSVERETSLLRQFDSDAASQAGSTQRRSYNCLSATPNLLHSGFHSLPQHLSFEFRYRPKYLKCESASRQCGVDVLPQADDIHTQCFALPSDGEKVFE